VNAEPGTVTGGRPHAVKSTSEAVPDDRTAGEAAPHIVDRAKADAMRANMSAIATADVGDLQTAGTLMGVTTVGNDAEIATSATGLMSVQGDVNAHQAVSWGVICKGDVKVDQGASMVTIAHDYKLESGLSGTVIATEATISRGWVGFLLAPRATISDDSRVLIATPGALIIGGAILVGFALLAMAGVRTARNAIMYRPKLPGLTWR
jgi:hypothetical protein